MTTPTDRTYRRDRWIAVAVFIIGIALLVAQVRGAASQAEAAAKAGRAAARAARSAQGAARAARTAVQLQGESDEISACRAVYAAAKQDADAALDDARAEIDLVQSVGLEATFTGDKQLGLFALAAISAAREHVSTARDQATEAADAYLAATKRSQDHRDEFLAECRAATPN